MRCKTRACIPPAHRALAQSRYARTYACTHVCMHARHTRVTCSFFLFFFLFILFRVRARNRYFRTIARDTSRSALDLPAERRRAASGRVAPPSHNRIIAIYIEPSKPLTPRSRSVRLNASRKSRVFCRVKGESIGSYRRVIDNRNSTTSPRNDPSNPSVRRGDERNDKREYQPRGTRSTVNFQGARARRGVVNATGFDDRRSNFGRKRDKGTRRRGLRTRCVTDRGEDYPEGREVVSAGRQGCAQELLTCRRVGPCAGEMAGCRQGLSPSLAIVSRGTRDHRPFTPERRAEMCCESRRRCAFDRLKNRRLILRTCRESVRPSAPHPKKEEMRKFRTRAFGRNRNRKISRPSYFIRVVWFCMRHGDRKLHRDPRRVSRTFFSFFNTDRERERKRVKVIS